MVDLLSGRADLLLTDRPWDPIQEELSRFFSCWPPTAEAVSQPSATSLNLGFAQVNRRGRRLRFVAQNEAMPFPELDYESRIFTQGLIATRANWHDTFNALIWRVFPRTKQALNTAHWRVMQAQNGPRRGSRRDALTLFDECGVVVLSRKRQHLHDLAAHRWLRLFVDDSKHWHSGCVQVVTFGHAMYEKYLCPYIGMTAKALLVHVPYGAPSQDLLDAVLARGVLDGVLLKNSSELAPLPVLGIPGWLNRLPRGFLHDSGYFRPPGTRVAKRLIVTLTNKGILRPEPPSRTQDADHGASVRPLLVRE